jgi:membrane protease YdiL (CAAX protease family)
MTTEPKQGTDAPGGGGGGPGSGSGHGPVARLLIGPNGLRAGYRLAIYAGIFLSLFAINDWLRARFMAHMDDLLRYGIVEILAAIDLVVAAAVMARIEKRRVGEYGLPLPGRRLGQYAWGLAVGFAWVTFVLAALAAAGAYHVQSIGGRASDMALTGTLFAALAFAIGIKEELYYRGYVLFTLASGVGFWPAAVLTSLWFGGQHIAYAHVTWLGGFNIALGGFLFSVMIRATGSLWMAIGAHAAIDWAEAFFYGVPISGQTIPGALIHPSITGPIWLTGGPAGPEGSIVFTAAMLPVAWALVAWMRRQRRSGRGERRVTG